ncbi:hypothetical protein [Acinetobacter baumannii]|uniref:hypothetical protein n=1 Tax=Acinetobacter baumannii TaxID=470 RepID=UPI000BF62B3D|nr:hypothetical protein [Acinetobacter baumannii]
MSEFKEFKVGDKVIWLVDAPWQWDVNAIHEIREHSHCQYKVCLGDEFVCWCGDQVFWQEFRHATPEEIAVGHRIDKPSNSRELEILDKPVGSLQELYPEFAKVLHENFLELLGDDFGIPNDRM